MTSKIGRLLSDVNSAKESTAKMFLFTRDESNELRPLFRVNLEFEGKVLPHNLCSVSMGG